jgi:hypothetical protein
MDLERAPAELEFLACQCPEGGYTARAVGYAIFTQADDLAELDYMVHDAADCHFDDFDRQRCHIRITFVSAETFEGD